jgi:acyl-CoA thioester hydrolase
MRRRRGGYFRSDGDDPPPIRQVETHRVRFSEVDAMAIAWHGRYLQFFEMAAEELCRRIGLSYEAYREAGLRAPLAQVHVDFHRPVLLGEQIRVEARLLWSEAARLDLEYRVFSAAGGLAASGFSVQLFTEGEPGAPLLVTPPLLQRLRERWRRGEFDNP